MKFQKSSGAYLPLDTESCTVTRMGDIVEVRTMTANPTGLRSITQISKDQYILNETGEVKDYQHGENRACNVSSLKQTFSKIRHYINNNFTGAKNELFVTLTYAENMTDVKRLYRDIDVFMKRLKRRFPGIEYFLVVEPQARGAWHCHILMKDTSSKKLYIPNSEMERLWGHGWTTTKRLNHCDNIGAYLSAYLADIELSEYINLTGVPDHIEIRDVEMRDENGSLVSKRMVKGGRCYLYPSGMNIFRHSRGIVPPSSEKMTYSRVKEIVGDATPDYSSTVEILDDEDKSLNTIRYYSFNLKRAKRQEGDFENDHPASR